MSPELQARIFEHARAEFPRECCGLVVVAKGRERYWPCRNLAIGTDQFVMDPHDYAAACEAGEVMSVVHSHPNLSPEPSQADRVSCEASGLPWHIVSVPTERWSYMEPAGYVAPLVGREWSHGVLDCYSIIRDWYALELRIDLPDFDRHDAWWLRGENLYLDNFERAGFCRVDADTMRRGDVLLMQIGSSVPNHGAVFLGDNQIIHHLQTRLSCRDVYGGMWRKNTTHVLRYEDHHSAG